MSLTAWNHTYKFREKIFNTILFFASEEGMRSLPNSEEAILLCLARAVVEYCGGNKETVPTRTGPYSPNWTRSLDEAVGQAVKSKSLGQDMSIALEYILQAEYGSDCLSKDSWKSGVYDQLQFRQIGFGETFCLTHPEVLEIQENISSHMTPADLEHCKQIGLLMRKNILAAHTAK